MKNPGWLTLVAIGALAAAAVSVVRASVPSFATLGDNTYACTRESSTTFARDTDKLIAEAKEDAAKFCATKGKHPKIVSISVEKPWITLGFPKATVVFKALEPDDPALADNAPVPVVRTDKKQGKSESAPTPAAVTAPSPSPVSSLYSDLMKLDELRKKGILTEEEFQAEKKKVLDRSK